MGIFKKKERKEDLIRDAQIKLLKLHNRIDHLYLDIQQNGVQSVYSSNLSTELKVVSDEMAEMEKLFDAYDRA